MSKAESIPINECTEITIINDTGTRDVYVRGFEFVDDELVVERPDGSTANFGTRAFIHAES